MGARAFRIFIYFNNGSVNTAIGELEFRATIGGAAQNGGVAIASSEFEGGSHEAFKAFDGTLATRWATLTGQPNLSWLGRDYGVGANVEVEEFMMGARSDCCTDQAPNTFILQATNGDPSLPGTRWADYSPRFTGQTWTLGQTRVYSGPFTPPTLEVTKLVIDEIPGASNTQLSVSKSSVNLMMGASPLALSTTKVGMNLLSGAQPNRLSASRIGLNILYAPSQRAVNGPVQIIG